MKRSFQAKVAPCIEKQVLKSTALIMKQQIFFRLRKLPFMKHYPGPGIVFGDLHGLLLVML